MYKEAPALARLDASSLPAWPAWKRWRRAAAPWVRAVRAGVRDFYLTNPIARASAVMAELSALTKSKQQGTTGTHG
jgi:NADH-quinone oxidoreductase subunit G